MIDRLVTPRMTPFQRRVWRTVGIWHDVMALRSLSPAADLPCSINKDALIDGLVAANIAALEYVNTDKEKE